MRHVRKDASLRHAQTIGGRSAWSLLLRWTSGSGQEHTSRGVFAMGVFLVGVIGIAIYLLPSFVAYGRKHPNETAIFVLNFLLGWTVVGWVGSLVWAFTVSTPQAPSAGVKATDDNATKNCPFCAEPVRAEAIKCKHCGSAIAESVGPAEHPPAVTDDQAMQAHGITLQDGKYVFRSYRYDKLSDAISYAKQQKSRASAAR